MFSVIIPVYNGEKFIDNAIESVISQTVSDWELIVVDDGSHDETLKVLEKYRENDKIHVVSQKNGGVSSARNKGVSLSKGEYLTFLDADDLWHNDHLEVMSELIRKYPDAGLYGTFTKTELVNGDVIENCNYFADKDEVYTEDFFEEYHKDKSAKMFTMITTCLKRQAFFKAGGFTNGCKIGEDLELSLVVSAYYPVVLSKKATATYKKENSTATKNTSFDPDWKFFERAEDLYKDNTIPQEKRDNLKKIMDWFTMRRCRHYLIHGKREKAMELHRNINKESISKKDLIINRFLLLMPQFVVRKIFEIRWRGKA